MQLFVLPVNRAHFGDTKDFHSFTLSHKTLYFPSLCGYPIGLSEKVPLDKTGMWKDTNSFKSVTSEASFLAHNTPP